MSSGALPLPPDAPAWPSGPPRPLRADRPPGASGRRRWVWALILLAVLLAAALALLAWAASGDDEEAGGRLALTGLEEWCATGADPPSGAPELRRDDCVLPALVGGLGDWWAPRLERQGHAFERPAVEVFAGATGTACGPATSEDGAFYCPADATLHLDLDLLDEVAAGGGRLAVAYLVAHEYAHHVQELDGTAERVGDDAGKGPGSLSVQVELQADCRAGAWAAAATGVRPFSSAEVAAGLGAVEDLGDDVTAQDEEPLPPAEYEHGTAAQRRAAVERGLRAADPGACGEVLAPAG